MKIDPLDIAGDLDQRHRDAMLDLILAWGSLDGALGMLLASARGLPLEVGADDFGKQPSSAKLEALRKIFNENPASSDSAKLIKSLKKQLEKHSFVRNRIAHSHCVGVWTRDREYVVFAAFERVGASDLALDAIPLEEIKRVTDWGRAMTALAVKMSGGVKS